MFMGFTYLEWNIEALNQQQVGGGEENGKTIANVHKLKKHEVRLWHSQLYRYYL